VSAKPALDLDTLPPTVDVQTAARILGISRGSAYEAVRRGDLYAIKLGRRLRVPTAWLRQKLEGQS
jgi:excisionase family DNA binding protein